MKCFTYSYLAVGLLITGFLLQAGEMPEPEIMAVPQAGKVQIVPPVGQDYSLTPSSPLDEPVVAYPKKGQTGEKLYQSVASGDEQAHALQFDKDILPLIPGFNNTKFSQLSDESKDTISKILVHLMPEFKFLHGKNYTPDIIPGTIHDATAHALKNKPLEAIVSFMNDTYETGLPYLTKAGASVFVLKQLPTTFTQASLSKIKRLFCMGQLTADDLLERARDMGVTEDIIRTYITEQISWYKKIPYLVTGSLENSAADFILKAFKLAEKERLGTTTWYENARNKMFKAFDKYIAKGAFNQMTILPFLTSLDGIDLLPERAQKEALVIMGFLGSRIKANAFKSMPSVKTVMLQAFQDFTIEDNAFAGLSNLEDLQIQGSSRATDIHLSSKSFAGLDKLTWLLIKETNLSEIVPGLFASLPNLYMLHLSNNAFETIEANTFKDLKKLGILHLENNQIHHVDKAAFNGLSDVTNIWLSYNRLGGLSAEPFKHLTKLKYLDVENNPLDNASVTKLRKGLRKGCYLFFPRSAAKRDLFSFTTDLDKLNQELSKEELQEATQ